MASRRVYALDVEIELMDCLDPEDEAKYSSKRYKCSLGCSAFAPPVRGSPMPVNLIREPAWCLYPTIAGLLIQRKLLEVLRPYLANIIESEVLLAGKRSNFVGIYSLPQFSAWSRGAPGSRYYACRRCRLEYLQYSPGPSCLLLPKHPQSVLLHEVNDMPIVDESLVSMAPWGDFGIELIPYETCRRGEDDVAE